MKQLSRICFALFFLLLSGCSGGGPTTPSQVDTEPPYWQSGGLHDAVSGNSEITIHWGAAQDTLNPPVKYLLYMDTDDNPFDKPPIIVDTNAPYTFKGLVNGQQYWFGVRASDSAIPPNIDTNKVTWKQTPWDPGPDTEPPYWTYNRAIQYIEPGDNFMIVHLKVATETRTPPIKYMLYIDTDSYPFDKQPVILNDPQLPIVHEFKNLAKGQEYWFGAKCSDSAIPPNVSPPSEIVSRATLGDGWLRTWTGEYTDTPLGLAVDSNDNVYLCGSYNLTMDFDPGPAEDIHQVVRSNAARDSFLIKLDNNGDFIWARTWGADDYDEANSVHVDNSGNILVTGYFSTGIDLDPSDETDSHYCSGYEDIYFSAFDTDGNYLWGRSWGGKEKDNGLGITLDTSGNIYVTGFFTYEVDFDPGAGEDIHIAVENPDSRESDAFLSKFDKDGNFIWARTWGGTESDEGNEVVCIDDSVYIGGRVGTSESLDFDPGPGQTLYNITDYYEWFTSSFNSSGDFRWVRLYSGGYAIASDSLGNLYSGSGDGVYMLDTDNGDDIRWFFHPHVSWIRRISLDSNNNVIYLDYGDLFKFGSGANFIWERDYNEELDLLAVDSSGNIFVAGNYTDRFIYSLGKSPTRYNAIIPPPPNYNTEIFLMRLDSKGWL